MIGDPENERKEVKWETGLKERTSNMGQLMDNAMIEDEKPFYSIMASLASLHIAS